MELPHRHHSENDIQHIAESLPNAETVAAVANAMKQLGDPTRLRIFWILCHAEECVVNLAAMMQMSSPAVAHHLRILKDAQLLRSRRSGKEVYYRASDAPLAETLHRVIESLASIACPQESGGSMWTAASRFASVIGAEADEDAPPGRC